MQCSAANIRHVYVQSDKFLPACESSVSSSRQLSVSRAFPSPLWHPTAERIIQVSE
jgi:hypothetical protein